ncbi:hypothetical protein B0H17DRAFT_1216878 [Mycena rosella]|uniref:Uncharacterized protein n=1 Tax=Mycena rosella TaxID=1033263 RepID=A0AAD7C373_MYCRO|nr:hypothetical protein B0H17DRAFT_1216878 [Mycena rosella]
MSLPATESKNVKFSQDQVKVFKEIFPITAAAAAVNSSSEVALTDHQLKILKHKERNEKARIHMANKCAAAKTLTPAEQEAFTAKERAYKAKYRESDPWPTRHKSAALPSFLLLLCLALILILIF